MSLVECLARAVPFQKWRKNRSVLIGTAPKGAAATENVLSHKKAKNHKMKSLAKDCKEGVPEINI
jgi:hypothetical protein